jgi:hypothetical protein
VCVRVRPTVNSIEQDVAFSKTPHPNGEKKTPHLQLDMASTTSDCVNERGRLKGSDGSELEKSIEYVH